MAVAPLVTLSRSPSEADEGSPLNERFGSFNVWCLVSGGSYDSISYAWELRSGPSGMRIFSFGSFAIATIPNIDANTTATIRCTVTVADEDGTGEATAHDDIDITLEARIAAPTALIVTQAQTVNSNEVIQLGATDSDPGGVIVSRAWTAPAVGGVFGTANQRNTSWRAPQLVTDTKITLTYTVTDDQGQTGSDTVEMTVRGGARAVLTSGSPTVEAKGAGVALSASRTGAPTADAIAIPGILPRRLRSGDPEVTALVVPGILAQLRSGAPIVDANLGIIAEFKSGSPTVRAAGAAGIYPREIRSGRPRVFAGGIQVLDIVSGRPSITAWGLTGAKAEARSGRPFVRAASLGFQNILFRSGTPEVTAIGRPAPGVEISSGRPRVFVGWVQSESRSGVPSITAHGLAGALAEFRSGRSRATAYDGAFAHLVAGEPTIAARMAGVAVAALRSGRPGVRAGGAAAEAVSGRPHVTAFGLTGAKAEFRSGRPRIEAVSGIDVPQQIAGIFLDPRDDRVLVDFDLLDDERFGVVYQYSIDGGETWVDIADG